MITTRSSGTFAGAGIFSAFAASLCCIPPLIALLAGSSSVAANFSWIEPARPYLIGLTIITLAVAWYVKLKPLKKNDVDCNCETPNKTTFLQSKAFLAIVTVFAILMMCLPLYAKVFYPKPQVNTASTVITDKIKQVRFEIQGMSCQACEIEVNNEISKLNGVVSYNTSYSGKNSIVTFDTSVANVKTIEAAINNTGYKVTSYNYFKPGTSSITFYDVPLVCNAAPSIGCGSRSKPALLELEKNAAVKEAWLNRAGTVIAIVWKDKPQTVTIAKPIFESNSVPYTELGEKETSDYLKDFRQPGLWYRGSEVDKLSKEEAKTIAESAVKFALEKNIITQAEAVSIKTDATTYFETELVKNRKNEQLNEDSQHKFIDALFSIAEKHIGQKRAEKAMALYKENCKKECKKDKSCSQNEGEDCCNKK